MYNTYSPETRWMKGKNFCAYLLYLFVLERENVLFCREKREKTPN